jgi:hypothetical protein
VGYGGKERAAPAAATGLRVESGAGAVAVRSGAVHALGFRRCGPETVLRFQSPLIKPCMPVSSTRLSEVFHLTAVDVAVAQVTVPLRTAAQDSPSRPDTGFAAVLAPCHGWS